MRSIVTALRAGRLIELPSAGKETSLRNLAHLIEAVPDLAPGIDLAEEILKREGVCNSGRRRGVACPHARVPGAGDLVCALGWSPAGIEYGAEDGHRVHLVVMYFIPDVQKNEYLKELSALAGAVMKEGEVQSIVRAKNIGSVRRQLLKWASSFAETEIPVGAPESEVGTQEGPEESVGSGLGGLPIVIVAQSATVRTVVCENRELSEALEKDPYLDPILRRHIPFERLGYRILHCQTRLYDPARPVYDLIAVRIG